MAGEWPLVPLCELTDPDTPVTYGVVKPGPEAANGVPFIRSGDIADGRVLTQQLRTITREVSDQYRRTQLRGGEIVVSLVGNPGQVAIVPESLRGANIARQAGLVRLRQGIDSRFVKYYLSSPEGQAALGAHSRGSVQQVINLRDLKTVVVPVPPLPEQRAIAHILGTLDDKIELNRRMSETLDAMAQALFKAWFVDSELGEIPEGWEVGTLADVVEQVRESENPLESPDIVFRHFSIPAYDDGQWPESELGASIRSLKSQVPAGVVLLSKLNPEVNRVWLVDVRPDDRAICSTEFVVLAPRVPFGRAYVYCLTRSQPFRQILEGLVTGTSKSHQRAQVNSILGLAVLRPPEPLLTRFDDAAEPLLARTIVCRREARVLASLRDALLPKLVSGEFRLEGATTLLESGK